MNKSTSNQSSKAIGWLAWTSASRAILLVVTIGSVSVLARILTPEEYGLFAAANIFITIGTSAFADGGFANTIVQRAELTKLHLRNAFAGILFLNVAATTIIFFGSGLAASFFEMPLLEDILKVSSVIVLFNAITMMSLALLRKDKKFRPLATIDVVASIFGNTAVAITLAVMGFGVWSLVIAQVTWALLRAGLYYNEARFHLIPAITRHMRDLIGLSASFSIASLFSMIGNMADNVVVGRVLGADALGIYSRVYRLLTIPLNVVGSSGIHVLFPLMSGINHDRVRMRRGYLRSISLSMLFALPLAALISHGAEGLIMLLLGDQWTAAVIPAQILFATFAFRVGMKITGIVAGALGAVRDIVGRQFAFAFFVIVGALTGSQWGLEGISAAISIAFVLSYLVSIYLSNRLIGVAWRDCAKAHFHGVMLAACVLTVLIAGENLVWSGAPIIYQFPIEALVTGLFIYLACVARPTWFMGSDGIWLLGELKRRAPGRLQVLIPGPKGEEPPD